MQASSIENISHRSSNDISKLRRYPCTIPSELAAFIFSIVLPFLTSNIYLASYHKISLRDDLWTDGSSAKMQRSVKTTVSANFCAHTNRHLLILSSFNFPLFNLQLEC